MKKAMIKKFIAAVMAFAMLFGSLSAFAAPAATPMPLPDGRNPSTPVSLVVHHTQGALADPVPGPGSWAPPGPAPLPPTNARPPVVGSTWRMVRVVAPALFVPDILDPPPAPAAGLSSPPLAVRNAIMAGNIDPATGAVTGQAGWYVTSAGTSAVARNSTTSPGATANVPHVPRAIEVTTNTSGIADFTEALIQDGLTDDVGQGMWMVWEVFFDLECPEYGEVTVGGTDRPRPTEYFDIIPPFLVNLPTYRHTHGNNATPPPDETGWLYRVHVFPKGARDTEFEKNQVGTITIGRGQPEVSSEYSIINWEIEIGFDNVLDQILGFPVTAANMTAMGAANLPGGLDTYILVTDELDYRLRLLPIGYTPIAAGGLVPTPMPSIVGDANADSTHWLSVSIIPFASDGVTELPAVGLDRMDGTDPNWVVVSEIDSPAVTPTPLPHPDVVQTFWVHFTENGIEEIVDLAEYGGIIRIFFRTWATNLTEWVQMDPIYNDATLNMSNRPGWNISERDPGGVPSVDPRSLVVNKINPSDVQLDGAVFFLFTRDQVTLTGGEWVINEVAGVRVLPHRVAISGGLAGTNPIIIRPPGNGIPVGNGLTDDEWALVQAQAALGVGPPPVAAQGEAVFFALYADEYFLYEAVAPMGNDSQHYRRITTVARIDMEGVCIYVGHANAAACAADEDNCVFRTEFDIEFTNTRDFLLPMTGGAGTIMFTTAGVSLMGIAGLFLFLARKKDKTKEVRTQ